MSGDCSVTINVIRSWCFADVAKHEVIKRCDIGQCHITIAIHVFFLVLHLLCLIIFTTFVNQFAIFIDSRKPSQWILTSAIVSVRNKQVTKIAVNTNAFYSFKRISLI